MDYEKMYKAVLKTATQWIKDGCSDKEKICLESIFPGLKESEDERIRNAIEIYLDWLDGRKDYQPKGNYTIRDMIAYLEKQKETANSFTDGVIEVRSFQRGVEEGRRLERQKENPKSADSISSDCESNVKCENRWHKVEDSLPDNGRLVLANDCLGNTLLARYDGEGNWEVSVYDNDDYYCRNTITKWCEIPSEKQKGQKHPNGCFTCDEYKKGYEEGRRNGFTAGYNKAMKEVEQKEQKPVVTHGETYHVDTLGTQQVIAGKMPQKPAEWSEEDEENFKWFDKFFRAESVVSGGKDIPQDKYLWFKSRRPQPKQEWSEEDEEMLNSCICSIEESKENRYAYKETDGDTSYDHEIAWLKSLPERFNLQSKQEQNDYITPHKEFFKFIYDRLINVHKENPNVDYMRSFKERLNNLSFGEKQEWSEEDEKIYNSFKVICERLIKSPHGEKFETDAVYAKKMLAWLKSLRPQSKDEIYKEKDNAFKLGKHQLAIQFMNYLDENRPEGKMSLSNGECEDIDKAFKENDWAKILRYAEKYGK